MRTCRKAQGQSRLSRLKRNRRERKTHLVDNGRLKVDVNRAGDVLARASLGEEGGETAVRVLLLRVLVDDATVRAETVLEAVELPAAARR